MPASLTSAGVTIVRRWYEGDPPKRIGLVARMVLEGAGGATHLIPATAFGLDVVESCSNVLDVTNSKVYPAVPAADGSVVHIADADNATAANHAGLGGLTTTAQIEIHGYRKIGLA